jgi:hypothetical protein
MNETTQKALMVEVERAVRPVRASQPRKLHMREELLSHLTAIFEAEFARCDDEQVALEQAKQRFGDPRELALELQQTVPILSRIRYLFEITGFRTSDSLLVFSVKYLLLTMIIFLAFFSQLLIIIFLRGEKPGELDFGLYLFSKLGPIIIGLTMLAVIFMGRLRKTFFSEGSRWFSPRAATDILICVFSLPLLAFIIYIVLTGNLTASLEHSRFACIFAPVAPVIYLLAARLYDHEMREQERWTTLEIDA